MPHDGLPELISVVDPSTGNARFINSFCTALRAAGDRDARALVFCAIVRRYLERPLDLTRVEPESHNSSVSSLSRLDDVSDAHYASLHMHTRRLSGALVVCLLASRGLAAASDAATLLRVFLNDGSSIVSYGELARVGDRVVFSMPTASTPNPPLRLVNLPADRIDWNRTNRYATSARAARYIETQADIDFAALSNQVAQALNSVALTTDRARRLAIVETARRTLAAWPQEHYDYKRAEVQQFLLLLDEAAADLRAASGEQRFALTLFAYAEPAPAEPLLPPPTPQEAIEQVLTVARVEDSPVERTVLLASVLESLDRDEVTLPAAWVASTRSATKTWLQTERRVDRAYQTLTARTMVVADRRAGAADVRALEQLVVRVHQRDIALGGKRSDTINSLIVAVQARLDAARQLRLARDRWALRASELRSYRVAIRPQIDLFASLKPLLEGIKALSGSSPGALSTLQQSVDTILAQISAVVPPAEMQGVHALLLSAVHLARNAGEIRREATLAGDVARAWDASSAAAGALMLSARARSDMQALLRPPQLR
jgi:hypothetical protein